VKKHIPSAPRVKALNKTVAQHITAKALVGLPGPVRRIVGSRIGSRVALIVVGLMLAYCALNIRHEGSSQDASQAAAVVRDEAREIANDLAHELADHSQDHSLRAPVSR